MGYPTNQDWMGVPLPPLGLDGLPPIGTGRVTPSPPPPHPPEHRAAERALAAGGLSY